MEGGRADNTRLMDRAAAGDEPAFGELARRVQDGLFRFALAHGLWHADAAEAVQETLLRAYQRRTTWRPGADAVSWLYGIAMNVVREFRRSRRRLCLGGIDLAGLVAAPTEPGGADEGELARLSAHLAELPPRQREAVVCRFLRRMSVRETAAAMGCAEGTVKAAVFGALKNLRKAMQQRPGPAGERE